MNGNKIYLCIDLKSFYASVECVERGWDPLTARLVVADPERSEKTICLAVSPALKQMGVPNRCRVFQIPKEIPYKMAPPRMQLYIDYAAEIYGVYLKYIRFLYNGIIIKHQKTEPTYTKTSLFLCEKRRFFMARREKGVVPIIYFEKERGKSF